MKAPATSGFHRTTIEPVFACLRVVISKTRARSASRETLAFSSLRGRFCIVRMIGAVNGEARRAVSRSPPRRKVLVGFRHWDQCISHGAHASGTKRPATGIFMTDKTPRMDLSHLDWPFFDRDHRAFAPEFETWASGRLREFEPDEGGDGVAARKIFELLAQSGWLQKTLMTQPSSRDRPKIDLRSVCLLREVCAYSSAMADVALSEPWLGILPIALYASPELRENLLPRYLSGRLLPAFALSEPGAGSDAAAITTTARLDGNHYVINGRKTWTSNSGLADIYIVFARIDGHEGSTGISAFAIDGNDSGMTLDQRLSVLPPHTVGTWSLRDVRVPTDRLIGEPGGGFKIAMNVLELFRPTVGAATLGLARRAMEEAIAHSVARTAFRKPISEHQLVQAKLADMAVSVDASALLVYRAAWQHDQGGKGIAREAAIAKYFSTERAFEVIDQAVQIFGGLGVLKGTTVERLFRHSRAFRIFDGTSEIQQLIIARDMLKGRDGGKTLL